MTWLQRIKNCTAAAGLIFLAIAILILPEDGYLVVFGLVSLSWMIQAIGLITYYFTMARFMVGGMRILLKAIILFDLSLFLMAMNDIPKIYVMVYLVIGMMFTNAVEVLKALDAKKSGNPRWEFMMGTGLTGIIIAIICLLNYKSVTLAGNIYALELLYWAAIRIYNSFRRTKIVYIQ